MDNYGRNAAHCNYKNTTKIAGCRKLPYSGFPALPIYCVRRTPSLIVNCPLIIVHLCSRDGMTVHSEEELYCQYRHSVISTRQTQPRTGRRIQRGCIGPGAFWHMGRTGTARTNAGCIGPEVLCAGKRRLFRKKSKNTVANCRAVCYNR